MVKIIKFYLFTWIVAVVLVSCKNGSMPVEKQKKIINYINELGAARTNRNNYLVVPQPVCHTCVEVTYEFFKQNKIPVNVILVGRTARDSIQIVENYTLFPVYLDRKELYYNRKNLLISTQDIVFFTMDKGVITNYHEINSSNILGTLKIIQKGTGGR